MFQELRQRLAVSVHRARRKTSPIRDVLQKMPDVFRKVHVKRFFLWSSNKK